MTICNEPGPNGAICSLRLAANQHFVHYGWSEELQATVEWFNEGYDPHARLREQRGLPLAQMAAHTALMGSAAPLGNERIEPQRGTRKALVLNALREAQGGWVDGTYIETAEVGGSQGTRRARELRADGWPIELRPHPDSDTAFQYRLGE